MSEKKAVVLLSGGLDSTTVLALAQQQGYQAYAMSFDYGQRHRSELVAARRVAEAAAVVEHRIIKLDIGQFGGSALTDECIAIPESSPNGVSEGIPVTYVPARNTVFLSLALAWSEVLNANDIFIGVNAVDYSGYPDCRPEYILAYEGMANLATKSAVEGQRLSIHTPLIDMTKAQIIRTGIANGVDYALTVSCYQADELGQACGLCDSCRLRAKGFADAGVSDPTPYKLTKNT